MILWTFRRNENDVVNLYNTLSPVMQLATGGNMLNFGYWHKEDISPINAQNRLCNKIGKLAELESASSLLDIGSGLSAPATVWTKLYPDVNISCLNINYIQLQSAKKIANDYHLSKDIYNTIITKNILDQLSKKTLLEVTREEDSVSLLIARFLENRGCNSCA